MTAITVHPTNPAIIWIGAATGGIWKTTDGGKKWAVLQPREVSSQAELPTLAVSSLQLDRSNPRTLYVATGDSTPQFRYFSHGILKIDELSDGSATWQYSLKWNPGDGRRIHKLVMHPADNRVLVAVATDGIYRFDGQTWSQVLRRPDTPSAASENFEATIGFRDLEVDAVDPRLWYAALWGVGMYISTDSGVTWRPLHDKAGALPFNTRRSDGTWTFPQMARVEMAIAPSDRRIIYAVVVKLGLNNGRPDYFTATSCHGLYRSDDAGESWRLLTDPCPVGNQANFDLVLSVSPRDPSHVYLGGQDLYDIARGQYVCGGAHQDYHALEWLPGNADSFLLGTDGGVYRYRQSTPTSCDNLSKGLGIHQIHRIASSPVHYSRVWVGAQDNGLSRYEFSTWTTLQTGDGGEVVAAADPSGLPSSEVAYLTLAGTPALKDQPATRSTGGFHGPAGSRHGMPGAMAVDPRNPKIVFLGTGDGVSRTTDGGVTWTTQKSGMPDDTTIRFIWIAPAAPDTIYAYGQNDVPPGYHLFSTDDGSAATITWTKTPTAPQWINGGAVHPEFANILWLAPCCYDAPRVMVSTDGGWTWSDYTFNLTDTLVESILIRPGETDQVYAGTHHGVFRYVPGGARWERYGLGLPNVVVNDLDYQVRSQCLRAGTWGRGLWELCGPPPPVRFDAVTAVSSYDRSVPLYWDPPDGYSPYTLADAEKGLAPTVLYDVWRAAPLADFEKVTTSATNRLYYRDETAQNGVPYAYRVVAHLPDRDVESPVAIAQASQFGRLVSAWLQVAPTIDGRVDPSEWADATTGLIHDVETGRTPVTLWIKNDWNAIYIAVEDSNVDDSALTTYRMTAAFDWNRNREWPDSPADERIHVGTGEAPNGAERMTLVMSGWWPDLRYNTVERPVAYAFGMSNGKAYHEMKVDLAGVTWEGTTVGLLVTSKTGTPGPPPEQMLRYELTGLWPVGPDILRFGDTPASFGDLVLAVPPLRGDANGDGAVTCDDVRIVRASFFKRDWQVGFDARADFNLDGVVNIRDLAFVARQLPAGTTCR